MQCMRLGLVSLSLFATHRLSKGQSSKSSRAESERKALSVGLIDASLTRSASTDCSAPAGAPGSNSSDSGDQKGVVVSFRRRQSRSRRGDQAVVVEDLFPQSSFLSLFQSIPVFPLSPSSLSFFLCFFYFFFSLLILLPFSTIRAYSWIEQDAGDCSDSDEGEMIGCNANREQGKDDAMHETRQRQRQRWSNLDCPAW
ncbi:hypothetical protein M431DRAFT_269251 [Trichoderma harzianum CBS 226.95]|uniref:Uncharacterized protein n=1 Tax=Trichoderma harzianum CBS 226.95 TaxID=983964 RepID=A0A2T3ZYN1_TRIHA|nr:hypothetical protein M431DRAFT_269251 [Trichoderma harzianum CBS 226.95]PTB49922.1 hypothetical protein M431DRAFT_269251 [Trichoderma harzianum CBS 226.95]